MMTKLSARRWVLSVIALAAAGRWALADTTVNFGFQWQDYGGTAHPLQAANVSFYDFLNGGTGGAPFAGPLTTDGIGRLQLVTPYANVDGANNLEIQPGIIATINGVGSAYLNNASATPYIFFPAGNSGVYLATINATTTYNNISFVNNTDASKMLEALQIVRFMKNYYADPATYNAALPAIRLNYSNANGGSSMGSGTMTLGYRDWGDIDVILHEYGHHVAEFNSLEGSLLGSGHAMNKDNIGATAGGNNYGALNGSKLAWQEGIATYLEQVAIIDGNLSAAIPGLPADAGNMAYDQFTPPVGASLINQTTDFSWSVAINNLNVQVGALVVPDPEGNFGDPTPGNPPFASRGKGEGDEMSVMRTLWDFQNNAHVENYARAGQTDYSNYGGKRIFNLAKGTAGANKGTFYAFWQAITTDVRTATGKPLVALAAADPDAKAVMRLGMTLEQNGISAIPLTFGAQASDKPTITWSEQNNLNSTKFEVLIYSLDWTQLIQTSPQIAAGVDAWTLTTPLATGGYEYVVLNSPALATAGELTGSIYNWYWSGDAVIAVPEPGSLLMLTLGAACLVRRRRRSC